MELLLAEELLLLALDDEKGSSWNSRLEFGLAGALLVDLGRVGALRSEGKELHLVDAAAPEHPLLVRAYDVIAGSGKPRSAKAWLSRLPRRLKPITGTVATGLVERGVLSEQRRKVLGVFPSTRFPQADPGPERLLRDRLTAVLDGQRRPEERDALLFGLLVPVELVSELVDWSQRRAARERAKQIADGGIAGDAVARAVQAQVTVAVTAAMAGAAGAAAGGAGAGGG
ncbi:MAG: GOLPH3/VPS74 family protein [Pseudonocardiaceae bacterium]